MNDRVGLADVGEELVPQALALGRAFDDARNVDELNCRRDDLVRLHDIFELLQAAVRHDDDTRVGFDRAKRIVLRRNSRRSKGVEDGALADVRQTDDSALKCHGAVGSSIFRAAPWLG